MIREGQYTERRRKRLQRLPIVSELYLKGKSEPYIRREVMKRLGLDRLSSATVHNDIKFMLEEWRKERLEDIDLRMERELRAIDHAIDELWQQWEKSCQDYQRVSTHSTDNGDEVTTTNFVSFGDPRYVAEIRAQLQERRKLLGLYPAEKKEISGNLSFAQALIESGIVEAPATEENAGDKTEEEADEDEEEDNSL